MSPHEILAIDQGDESLSDWRTARVTPSSGDGESIPSHDPLLWLDSFSEARPSPWLGQWRTGRAWVPRDWVPPTEATVFVIKETVKWLRRGRAVRFRLQPANDFSWVPLLLLTPADLDREGWADEVDAVVGLLHRESEDMKNPG